MHRFFFIPLLLLFACSPDKRLPVYGEKVAVLREGKADSITATLSDINLTDQEGTLITDRDLRGKICVADFFFTACPSICAKMKKEMLRVYKAHENDDNLLLLSFSIDPSRDSVERLKTYSEKLGINDNRKWHFLTGDKTAIYELAERLMIQAAEDKNAPGGFVHNGKFVLFDKTGRIRGFYDGTQEESVNKLLSDLEILSKE